MTFLDFILTLGFSLGTGLIAYYIGYMTGTEREHDRLCEQWLREKREDGE